MPSCEALPEKDSGFRLLRIPSVRRFDV